ncbi:MAG: hypothetical protein WBL49_13795 [Nitrososphaeraceae archaeon]
MDSLHGIADIQHISYAYDINIVEKRRVVDLAKFDNNNNNNGNQKIRLNNYLIWLFIYMSIWLATSMMLPFPISLVVFLLALFVLSIVRAEIALRKAGMGGVKGLYKSYSSLGFGRSIGNGLEYAPLKFYCMNCGNEHREVACPKCGSKAVKAG